MNATRQPSFATTAAWLLLWTIVALAGSRGIRDYAKTERMQRLVALDQQLQELKKEQAERLNVIEQNLRQKSREAEARRKAELEAAWGGPVAAAFKNPELDLRQALLRAAKAAAWTNALVSAEVDRFSEFVVTIEGRKNISTNQMIDTARALVPVAKDYLTAVRFSHRGVLVGELDRHDLEFIDDWVKAPDQRIAMLLGRENESRVAEDPAAIERLRDEQRIGQALAAQPDQRDKVEEADRNFRQSVQTAYEEFKLALELLQKAMALGEVHTLRDLDERDKELSAAVEHADRARAFWDDPAREWQRLLEVNGVGGELKATLVKGFPAIFRTDPKKTANVLDALRGMTDSSVFLMGMLTRQTEKWKFSGGGIFFTDPDFARSFEKVQAQLREDTQAMEAALLAWRDAVGP